MTFDQWFYETQGFALRCEWFDADLVAFMDNKATNKDIEKWLKSAWQVGYEHAISNLTDDGK